MTTLAETPALAPANPPAVSRETAMAWYAIGRTAQSRRALASLPVAVSRFADIYGVSPEEMRASLLAVADGIDMIVAEGLTRVQCWYLAGLDQFHGAFPVPVVPAQRVREATPA